MAAVERIIYTQMAQDIQNDYDMGRITYDEYCNALDAMAQAITGME